MESLQQRVQKVFASPVVKKLRTLEQSRMARISQRHKESKDRLIKTLEHVDIAVKEELTREATRRAEDLQQKSKDILELIDSLSAADRE